ncbi:MAG TPA: ferrous iron transporter B, partial [Actinotalea sp.]|nr:ferrous iron transporter B [Actinotalea sp.]
MSCHAEPAAPVTGTTHLALLGAPNCGKSTVFNQLTGLRAKTANYPGVTVTRTVGEGSDGTRTVTLTDLPGTYGMEPASPDEAIVVEHLAGRLGGYARPDALLVVVDATSLRRSLALVADAMATGTPCAVVLTMTDELAARDGRVDATALARALGVPVFPVVAHRGRGIAEVRAAALDHSTWTAPVLTPPVEDRSALAGWVTSVAEAAGYVPAGPSARTRGIDRVLLHPVLGLLAFGAVMTAFFQTIFAVAAPAQGWIETFFAWLGQGVAGAISQPVLADFVQTALIGGVGGVLVFLPQIALLFVLLSLLEGVGYLSRAAVLMDRVMAISGLDGRAFVAMLSSVACAIPGIMSTRTMPSSRDRLATMLAAPLMPCAAR